MRKTLNCLVPMTLVMVIFSPYISSWLPRLVGMPVGPILRQLVFSMLFVYVCSIYQRIKNIEVKSLFRLYLFCCLLTVFAFLWGPSTLIQYAVGVSSFVFYPVIFIFLIVSFAVLNPVAIPAVMKKLDRFMVVFFISVALIGIFDVLLDGELVLLLGYDPNYGGEDFSLITSYNGVVRANAGVADALAFGYLMAVAVIYFFSKQAKSPSRSSVFGVSVCTLACMLSLTRGALISVIVTYAFYTLNRKRIFVILLMLPVFIYLVSISPYAELFVGRFTDSDEASETSSLLRVFMALNSLDFLASNPMGIGIGTQGAGNTLSDVDNRLNTDNYFFHIFLELGVYIGFVFCYFLYRQFSLAFKYIESKRFIYSYSALFLVSALLSSSIAYSTLAVFFWSILFMEMIHGFLRKNK